MRPGGLWVHPGWFGSLWSALGALGLCESLSSSEVVRFTLVRRGGHCVHPGSLGSLGCTLGVVRFFQGGTRVRARGRWVHHGSLGFLGVVLIVRSRWIHSYAPWGLLRSTGVVRFTRERTVVRWVHAGSLGSSGSALGYALGVVGFIRGCWVHSGAPWGCFGVSGVDGFTRVCPGGRCVHPVSLGSLRCAKAVVGFNLGRWVHSGAPWVS